jgi:hypothetical protein
MALSYDDVIRLFKSGFVFREIKTFNTLKSPSGEPQVVDLDTKTWMAMMQQRRMWREDRLREGWSPREIEDAINGFYEKDRGNKPTDFLKGAYKPPRRISDYKKAVRVRMRTKITKKFGREYFRGR